VRRFGVIPKPTVSRDFSASPDERSMHHVYLCPVFQGTYFFRKVDFMNKRTNKIRLSVFVGVFSAIAFILQLIGSMAGIKVSGFLEVEISDLPALIIALAYGPLAGVLCELIKNLLHLTVSTTGFVGELANFVINGTLCYVAGMIYKHNKTFRGALCSLIFGVFAMLIMGIVANLYIMLPLYMPAAPFHAKMTLVLSTMLPFNAVRGFVLSLLTLLLYKRISPLLHKSV